MSRIGLSESDDDDISLKRRAKRDIDKMKAELEISQSRSLHLIRYMAQIPMPTEHFDTVLMEIQQMEHETSAILKL
jgi:hypothetical protein